MKLLLPIFFLLTVTSVASAGEKRTYTKVNPSEAKVVIETDQLGGIQAASFVDGRENERFIQEMFKDKNSKLYQLRAAIEKENCNKNSTPEKPWIDGCGQVTLTKEVETSFGRGGWASAGAGYTFFIGFTNEGTGRFFDVSHMASIGEDVEAQTTTSGDYAGKSVKTLTLQKVIRIDEHTP